jgi:hypothetical protein
VYILYIGYIYSLSKSREKICEGAERKFSRKPRESLEVISRMASREKSTNAVAGRKKVPIRNLSARL